MFSPKRYSSGAGLLAFVVLFCLTLMLFGDTLHAFWRADDGHHLGFASHYSVWQYTFVPDVVRRFSVSMAPWNALTYTINLHLFGLHPQGFYAHQLLSVCLAAWVTFRLLRLWLTTPYAYVAAVLFLLGAPTLHIANELMTGHYLEGLIFAILCLHCYVRWLRGGRRAWHLAALAWYVLAIACKEVYVPLPALLLFMPETTLRMRTRATLPFALITGLYFIWRHIVFGMVLGGYNPSAAGYDYPTVVPPLLHIPVLLFGGNWLGLCGRLAALALLVPSLWAYRRHALFMAVCVLVLIAPLVPLTVFPGIVNADRYLFFLWWMLTAALVWAASCSPWGLRLSTTLLIVAGFAAAMHGFDERQTVRQGAAPYEAAYRFTLQSHENDVLLEPEPVANDFMHDILLGMIEADRVWNHTTIVHSRIVLGEDSARLLSVSAAKFYRYDAQCLCTRPYQATLCDPSAATLDALFATVPYTLNAIVIAPPYPPKLDSVAGYLDRLQQHGRQVSLSGWTAVDDHAYLRSLVLGLPVMPISQQVERRERADVAQKLKNPALQRSGFDIELTFSSDEDARRVAQNTCVASMSERQNMSLLNGQAPVCSSLVEHTAQLSH